MLLADTNAADCSLLTVSTCCSRLLGVGQWFAEFRYDLVLIWFGFDILLMECWVVSGMGSGFLD